MPLGAVVDGRLTCMYRPDMTPKRRSCRNTSIGPNLVPYVVRLENEKELKAHGFHMSGLKRVVRMCGFDEISADLGCLTRVFFGREEAARAATRVNNMLDGLDVAWVVKVPEQ